MILVFTYGTLTASAMMKDVCPTAIDMGVDTLHGFGLTSSSYLTPVKALDETLKGVVWQIAEKSLDELDYYEGYPHLYTREYMLLDSGRSAWTYFMQPRYASRHRSEHHRMAKIGYAEHGIPLDQIVSANNRKVTAT